MRKRITRIRNKLAFVFQRILLIEPALVSLAQSNSNSRLNLNAPAIGRAIQNQIQAPLLEARVDDNELGANDSGTMRRVGQG